MGAYNLPPDVVAIIAGLERRIAALERARSLQAAGVASLPFGAGAGSGSVTVTHGLAVTPARVLVSQNGAGGPSPIVLQVDNIGATTFRIYGEFRTGTTVGAINVPIAWEAAG